jgi:hypothetical protein
MPHFAAKRAAPGKPSAAAKGLLGAAWELLAFRYSRA